MKKHFHRVEAGFAGDGFILIQLPGAYAAFRQITSRFFNLLLAAISASNDYSVFQYTRPAMRSFAPLGLMWNVTSFRLRSRQKVTLICG
jgi:hypothetical protein